MTLKNKKEQIKVFESAKLIIATQLLFNANRTDKDLLEARRCIVFLDWTIEKLKVKEGGFSQ
mgnify:CR=1 FL=1